MGQSLKLVNQRNFFHQKKKTKQKKQQKNEKMKKRGNVSFPSFWFLWSILFYFYVGFFYLNGVISVSLFLILWCS
jgi:hypothetical protein